jgi:hypothetical protein
VYLNTQKNMCFNTKHKEKQNVFGDTLGVGGQGGSVT